MTTFVPVAAKNAFIINISTDVIHLLQIPGYSASYTSKLSSTKFFEDLHYKYPEFFVLNVYPGVTKAAIDAKTVKSGTDLPYEEGEQTKTPGSA